MILVNKQSGREVTVKSEKYQGWTQEFKERFNVVDKTDNHFNEQPEQTTSNKVAKNTKPSDEGKAEVK